MDPKPQPDHRQYLEALSRMTPQQRVQKAFELSEMMRQLLMCGLRQRFPNATPEEFRRVLLEVLDRCHNNNY
jgi:hypothetical protein